MESSSLVLLCRKVHLLNPNQLGKICKNGCLHCPVDYLFSIVNVSFSNFKENSLGNRVNSGKRVGSNYA